MLDRHSQTKAISSVSSIAWAPWPSSRHAPHNDVFMTETVHWQSVSDSEATMVELSIINNIQYVGTRNCL